MDAELWFFAVGSLVNPTVLLAFDLHPVSSVPAELMNHIVAFMGDEAVAFPRRGESCFGVVHKVLSLNYLPHDPPR